MTGVKVFSQDSNSDKHQRGCYRSYCKDTQIKIVFTTVKLFKKWRVRMSREVVLNNRCGGDASATAMASGGLCGMPWRLHSAFTV